MPSSRRAKVVKRSIDIVFSLTVLVAASPVMAAVALGVAFTMGRPVLFRQERTGRGLVKADAWVKLRVAVLNMDRIGKLPGLTGS